MGLKSLFPPSLFPYEDLTLVKKSGEKIDKKISACVHKSIEIDDMSLDIEEGDYLIRTLPIIVDSINETTVMKHIRLLL